MRVMDAQVTIVEDKKLCSLQELAHVLLAMQHRNVAVRVAC